MLYILRKDALIINNVIFIEQTLTNKYLFVYSKMYITFHL